MDPEVHKQEFSIRNAATKSVTLFPTKAQVIRTIPSIGLKPGQNQLVLIGITPTADEHSIKVDGTGAATISDLKVELVPNQEDYLEIYPDEDVVDDLEESEDESEPEEPTGRLKEVIDRLKEVRLEAEDVSESSDSVNKRREELDHFLQAWAGSENATSENPTVDVERMMSRYREERAKTRQEFKELENRSTTLAKEESDLLKEQHRLTKKSRYAKQKEAIAKAKKREKEQRKKNEEREAKQRVHDERAKFWPKKVFKVTISLETPSGFTPGSSRRGSIDSTVKAPLDVQKPLTADDFEINLVVSYVTYSASWMPRYDLSLNTPTKSGTLDYSATLTNATSETWRDAKVVLSTSQSTYAGLTDVIPTLQPWHVRLQPGSNQYNANGALTSAYETAVAQQQRSDRPTQLAQPRHELFGLPGGRAPYATSKPPAMAAPPPPRAPAPMVSMIGQDKMRKSSAAVGGGLFGSTTAAAPRMRLAAKAARRAPGGGAAQAEQYIDYSDEDAGYGSQFVGDDATLAFAEPALAFEESSFEEAGLTTTYDLPGLKTLVPSSSSTKHKIARVEFKSVAFSHVLVPKLRAAAFLKARLRNSSGITLLKGTAGLTLDGSFLGQSTIPRASAGESFTLPLGVDPTVQVAYSKPTVQRSSSGIFSKEDSEVFTRVATLTNTKPGTSVELTMLDQVPVSEDERLRIEILTPRGLKIGGDPVPAGHATERNADDRRAQAHAHAAPPPQTGASRSSSILSKSGSGSLRASVYETVTGVGANGQGKWGAATATAKPNGEVAWAVRLEPGRGVRLVLEYAAAYPGSVHIVGA
jgi:hypothetical protein